MWDHAYFYVFERETWQGRVWEDIHPRVHFVFDNRHPFGGSHHEKICIIDGRVALCGGIDLCDERWDSPDHLYHDPRRSLSWRREHHGPYHDLAVQVTGPVCGKLQSHIAERWQLLSSVPFPEVPHPELPPSGPPHRVYFSRTIAGVDAGRFGISLVREIEFLFQDLVRGARERIVLEGQYFWSEHFTDTLVAKILERKGKPFEVILILSELGTLKSLTRNMALWEARQLHRLESAARYAGTRFRLGFPYVFAPESGRPNPPPKPAYVHSKVLIVDDRFLSIGSANFADRAFRLDTEVSLTLEARDERERAHIRRVTRDIRRHWNLDKLPNARNIWTRRPCPRRELTQLQRQLHLRLPWHRFFDPSLPWLYPLKRKYRALARRKFPWTTYAVTLLWLLATIATLALAGGWDNRAQFAIVAPYAALLSAGWLLPLPFVALCAMAGLRLGGEIGPSLAVASYGVCAIWGYGLARMFPTTVTRWFRRTAPAWLPAKLRQRSFPSLISVLADPRISIRSKLLHQGLGTTPLPWFAFGNFVVLPAALGFATRAAARWENEATGAFLAKYDLGILSTVAFVAIVSFTWKLWKNTG